MTLVLALKWLFDTGEAVLVASDSKATTPIGITYEIKKVYPIELSDKPVGIASGAGDVALVKWGFEQAEAILLTKAQQEYPLKFTTFKDAVDDVQSAFIRKFNELKNLGIRPEFQMILCGLDLDGKASIYLFDNRGLAEPVHDNPGYAIIGSGFVTGGNLLLRLLGYTTEKTVDLGILTTFILDAVSEVDATVGSFVGESFLMRINENKGKREILLGPIKPTGLSEQKKKAALRKELISKLWWACDIVGEKKVEQFLKKLLK